MKTLKYSFVALMALSLAACGGGGTNAEQMKDPSKIRQAIQTKKEAIKTLEGELAQLQKRLGEVDTTARPEKFVDITTQSVQKKTFSHYVEVQGNIATAQEPAFASSETGGRITELLVREDQYVKKGDLVAKVDVESIRKSLEELKASLKLAQDMYDRQKKLWEQKIGSEVQFLQAESQVEQLTKSKERLEFELSKTNVYAPISGYVEQVMLKAGEFAGPGTPIIQVLNTNDLKVIAQVPENLLGKVKVGDKVELFFPALGESQSVRVNEVSRSINSTNRTFAIEAAVASQGGLVKPNLMATIKIKDFEAEDVVVVDNNLILQDVDGNNYLMLAQNGLAKKRIIELGRSYQNETMLESGLQGDETLIVKGARQAIDGDKVKVLSKATAQKN
ncbi:efflux RND transporter periplasmic adaptor subunit [Saprospira sp. CCB-QB6]|uniref:efflux RND transporter periplasmic adaptor subunit n=1 Tax=Saprospira sp. CCB-QB6 TaxID=3023936 RepID=UPI00234BD750|nr:efflux RND transporter periplasmic adaptor subunit [Saprospira sp. CCB-QB6]WCL80342.1 efflux RND transporter periplasmic adaptor subunit [Saprospira sp. CCB-QB6]